ncbi:pyrimidine 5'-nucleotidase [soil metagenome]
MLSFNRTATRAVLFDLDDTLFDHQYSSQCGLATLRQRYTCFQQKSLSELQQTHLRFLDTWHDKVLQGVLSLDEARTARFRQLFEWYGERASDAMVDTATTVYRQIYQAARRPVPGVLPLLQQLRASVKIGVVTNNLLSEQQEKLAYCGLTPFVDLLIVSEEVGVAKPDPAIFQAALQRLEYTVSEVVMVGDSWRADILGATNLGIRAIWLNRHALPCPDPMLATEIHAFEPIETVITLLLH